MKKLFKILICVLVIILLCYTYFYFRDLNTLKIQTPNGVVSYHVEKALTPEQQQTGLMHRKKLAEKSGMIFLFKPVRIARMWMKNTLIPLDMVFFDLYGRVVRVHHNAIPQDLTIISSERPVSGVLEINAGEAKKYGIGPGSTLDLSNMK
ncbi:MAG: DUF192 domain-containing protein [Alphaproteobacteria bacterium]|nr:DUF192 domain-containing protein [Alphaproteobacteria bacterium]